MAKSVSLRTRVSTKGQVVLPKAVRERRGWTAGSELILEERPEGVLLRPASKETSAAFDEVRGSLGSVDRIISVEDMHQGVLDEARRRWRRKSRDRG
ncbi:MAG TPA: AbrB/MazE/SpoVT family DNA-binding domain-containing protein [Roseiarcus sp.]